VDNKEFRNLLLLLKEDLEENNIPHRTTMTKRILDLHAEQNEHLSNQMLVSLFNLFVLHLFYFILEELHGKNLFYYGHLVRPQYEILYGSYCALAAASLSAAVWKAAVKNQLAFRSGWIYACSWLPHWRALV
jgi:hypothetical protein